MSLPPKKHEKPAWSTVTWKNRASSLPTAGNHHKRHETSCIPCITRNVNALARAFAMCERDTPCDCHSSAAVLASHRPHAKSSLVDCVSIFSPSSCSKKSHTVLNPRQSHLHPNWMPHGNEWVLQLQANKNSSLGRTGIWMEDLPPTAGLCTSLRCLSSSHPVQFGQGAFDATLVTNSSVRRGSNVCYRIIVPNIRHWNI